MEWKSIKCKISTLSKWDLKCSSKRLPFICWLHNHLNRYVRWKQRLQRFAKSSASASNFLTAFRAAKHGFQGFLRITRKSVQNKNWKQSQTKHFFIQNVWKSPKISHLSFSILAFSTNICPIKIDLSGTTVWPQVSSLKKVVKIDYFWLFWWTFVHSKCKRSSLRSQCWMRPFRWFSNTVIILTWIYTC